MCERLSASPCDKPENPAAEEKLWHAMRATYGRALKAREYLDGKGIRSFVPMRYEAGRQGMRGAKRLVPVMSNIIFVHAEQTVLQQAKRKAEYLQYMTNSRTGEKIIVPEKDMKRFIAVCGTLDEHLLWLGEDTLQLERGQYVRVTGGPFKGQEGVLLKVKGARDKRVVVAIKGVMAVALASVPPQLIEEL